MMFRTVWHRIWLRLILLLLPWLIILSVPHFRRQLGLTVSGGRYAAYATPWTTVFNPFPRPAPTMADKSPAILAEKALRITSGFGAVGPQEQWKILQFGRLSDQHPREAWIIALALRHLSSTRDGRVEYKRAAPRWYGYPEDDKSDYTAAAISEGYRLVQRGQSLEPDNAFFDWHEIHLLLVQRRDREALELLERAVRKPNYNEHLGEVMAAHVEEQEAIRPLFADERILMANAITFPDWSAGRHMRGTLLWRIGQLEENGRNEEAISLGWAMRRMSIMQMRATPFWLGRSLGGSGLFGVWTTGKRKTSAIPKTTAKLLGTDRKRYSDFVSHRYFQYLREHGHRELLPEARAQLVEYQTMIAPRSRPGRTTAISISENPAISLDNVLWSFGGWCFAGVLLFGLIYLLLFPVGLRSALQDVPTHQWPPARGALYPQLLGWGGVVLCMAYASYLQFFENYNGSDVYQGPDLVAPSMMLSYIALVLPLAVAVANQMLVRKEAALEGAEGQHGWTPEWRELGMPEQPYTLLARCWGVFTKILFVVGLLCTPLTIAWILGIRPVFSWGPGAPYLPPGFPALPPIEIATLGPPILVGLWAAFRVVRLAVLARQKERTLVFRAIRDFRRCCGSYAIAFSWLLLLVLAGNFSVQAKLDENLRQFLAQTSKWSQIALTEPAPAPKAIQALPPIPVFPTPTPVAAALSPLGGAPAAP